MAHFQLGMTTPNGSIVSFGDIDAILRSVDSGQPFQISVTASPVGNDQNRTQLQIQNSGEVNDEDVNKRYDSRALVKHLNRLQLGNGRIVKQILTSPRPAALSELTAAHDQKSIIPLVTADDGRVFSIQAGVPANGNWAGEYGIGFTTGTPRKLSDPALANAEITTYQSAALKNVLAAVMNTEDSAEFRKPVEVLYPDLEDYQDLIAEPIDLGTMRDMLDHDGYAVMTAFCRHVDLLVQNARTYHGDGDEWGDVWIVAAAKRVSSDIYRRMSEISAEPPVGGESVTQVRMNLCLYLRSLAAANSTSDVGNDTDTGENQNASDGGSVGSQAEAEHPADFWFVLPLGRLCVTRPAGGDEAIVTPYIVVMNLESEVKSLWLVKDFFTPLRLPDDEKALLNFGGWYNFTLGFLGPLDEWTGEQAPTLRWSNVVRCMKGKHVVGCIKDRIEREPVHVYPVQDQQHAAAAIKKDWKKIQSRQARI